MISQVDINELWSRLALEGRHHLMDKLRRAERHEPGFGTIVVKKEGFSEDDETHNLVLKFLRQNGICVFNPGLEVTRLERALHCNYYEG
jgi:hypothetical protein